MSSLSKNGREASMGISVPIRELTQLPHHAAARCAELYDLAIKHFGLASLNDTCILFTDDGAAIACETGTDEYSRPYVAMHDGPIPHAIRYRLQKQLRLPPGSSELPDSDFLPITFAHALGHALQADANVDQVFGSPIDQHWYSPQEATRLFESSDREWHANYVAAILLGLSSLQSLGLLPPSYASTEWEDWANLRRDIAA